MAGPCVRYRQKHLNKAVLKIIFKIASKIWLKVPTDECESFKKPLPGSLCTRSYKEFHPLHRSSRSVCGSKNRKNPDLIFQLSPMGEDFGLKSFMAS